MSFTVLHTLIFISGILHIVLGIGSSIIPKVLQWKKELADVQPLIRQMFWTYAAYILVINLCIGLLSIFCTDELLNHSNISTGLTFFIGMYWFARIGIQFFYFDKTSAPKGFIFTLGEIALVALFVYVTIVYFVAFLFNMSWM